MKKEIVILFFLFISMSFFGNVPKKIIKGKIKIPVADFSKFSIKFKGYDKYIKKGNMSFEYFDIIENKQYSVKYAETPYIHYTSEKYAERNYVVVPLLMDNQSTKCKYVLIFKIEMERHFGSGRCAFTELFLYTINGYEIGQFSLRSHDFDNGQYQYLCYAYSPSSIMLGFTTLEIKSSIIYDKKYPIVKLLKGTNIVINQ